MYQGIASRKNGYTEEYKYSHFENLGLDKYLTFKLTNIYIFTKVDFNMSHSRLCIATAIDVSYYILLRTAIQRGDATASLTRNRCFPLKNQFVIIILIV